MAVAAVIGIGVVVSLVGRCSGSGPERTTPAASVGPASSKIPADPKAAYLQKVDAALTGIRDLHSDEAESDYVNMFYDVANVLGDASQMQLTHDEQLKVASLRAELVKRQLAIFPVLRRRLVSSSKQSLWLANATARTYGARDTTIEFVAGGFASHATIQAANDTIYARLARLRFKRVVYKWIPSAEDATQYTIDTPPDEAVARIDEVIRAGIEAEKAAHKKDAAKK
jgi:hypothetical protein